MSTKNIYAEFSAKISISSKWEIARLLSGLLGLTIFAGCATQPFQPGKPLQIEGGSFLSHELKQDGKPVDVMEVMKELKKSDAAKNEIGTGETWFYTSIVLGGIGGYLIGYNLVSSADSKQQGLLLGVGITGLALGASYLADQHIVNGINSYNGSLKGKKSEFSFHLIPLVAFLGGNIDIAPLAEFSLGF